MVIPVKYVENRTEEEDRAIRDLLFNSQTKDYLNEKSYKQKLIDLLYKLGYYKDSKSIFEKRRKD